MCVSPLRVVNGSDVYSVPCGRCRECVSKRKNDWFTRLSFAADWADCAFFTLLSFDAEHYNFDVNDLSIRANQIKICVTRLRNYFHRRYGDNIKVKYYIASEFGERRDRLHYHALFFIKGIELTWVEFNTILHQSEVFDRKLGKVLFMPYYRACELSKEYIRTKSRHKVTRYKVHAPIWEHGIVAQCYNVKMNRSRLKYTVKYIQKDYNTSYYSRFSALEVAGDFIRSLIFHDFKSDIIRLPLPQSLPRVSSRRTLPRTWLHLVYDLNVSFPSSVSFKETCKIVLERYYDSIPLEVEVNQSKVRHFLQQNFQTENPRPLREQITLERLTFNSDFENEHFI